MDLQTAAALALVALASAYLAFLAWRMVVRRRKSTGCGSGCAACPAGDDAKKPVVTLDALVDSARKR